MSSHDEPRYLRRPRDPRDVHFERVQADVCRAYERCVQAYEREAELYERERLDDEHVRLNAYYVERQEQRARLISEQRRSTSPETALTRAVRETEITRLLQELAGESKAHDSLGSPAFHRAQATFLRLEREMNDLAQRRDELWEEARDRPRVIAVSGDS